MPCLANERMVGRDIRGTPIHRKTTKLPGRTDDSAPHHDVRYIGQEGIKECPTTNENTGRTDERDDSAARDDSRRAARVPLGPRALSKLAIDGLLLRLSSLLTPLRHGGARGGPCAD